MTAQTPCETCCETWWAVLKYCNLSYTKTRIRSTITSYCITWRIWRTEYVPITMIPINYFAMSSVWRQEKGRARQTSGHRTENKAPSEAAEKPWNGRMWFQHTPKKMYIQLARGVCGICSMQNYHAVLALAFAYRAVLICRHKKLNHVHTV